MDRKRLAQIQEKLRRGDMSTQETLQALSEVSEVLHRVTGEERYKRVADASGILAIGEEKGLSMDVNIKMALDFLEEENEERS